MFYTIRDIFLDALIDSFKMLPFLFFAFLVMEFFEHKAGGKLTGFLQKCGNSHVAGPFAGAAVGIIPQCGFSVAASNLYSGRMITIGTLMAVYLSTSDEAVPVLLAHPESAGLIWKLLLAKFLIAVTAGIIIDIIAKVFKLGKKDEPFAEICTSCGCGEHGIFYSSAKHTINIFCFIFAVNIILTGVFTFVGEERVADFLQQFKMVQPFVAAFVGLVPNCAASVVITQLYAEGGITFGSAVAGLLTSAGVGIVVLFRTNKNTKENILILALLYVVGVLSGSIINLI